MAMVNNHTAIAAIPPMAKTSMVVLKGTMAPKSLVRDRLIRMAENFSRPTQV